MIRILAAFAVLISHSFILSGAAIEPLKESTGVSLGTMAVDIFFITSGFLVSASLINRKSIIEYSWARLLRIYPALLVMLAMTVLCAGIFWTTIPAGTFFTSSETGEYLVKNATLIAGVSYFLPGVFEHNPYKGSVNGSLWSMRYEVRFYVIIAMIWAGSSLIPNNRLRFFKAATITSALLLAFWHLFSGFDASFGDNLRHLGFMFFSGATFYLLKEHVPLAWPYFSACVLALALALSLFNARLFFMVYSLALPYILFFLAYIPSGAVRLYNQLGDYSYGVYIYAFPVQQSIVALNPGITPWRLAGISIPFVLVLAVISWHFIESRALGMKSSLLSHTRRIIAARTPV